jgi:hypothetical protein
MDNSKELRYQVQVLDWNQFMPVEEQRWICAGLYDSLEKAEKALTLFQFVYDGVRVTLNKN